jgi:PBP1b-binding outer membrane lipoprotein LpoB
MKPKKMDNTGISIACATHMVLGGIIGGMISSILEGVTQRKLEKQLDIAIDDMFNKDLQLDELTEQIKKLTNELNEFKSKFPVVDVSEDVDDYISDSSTELGNMD